MLCSLQCFKDNLLLCCKKCKAVVSGGGIHGDEETVENGDIGESEERVPFDDYDDDEPFTPGRELLDELPPIDTPTKRLKWKTPLVFTKDVEEPAETEEAGDIADGEDTEEVIEEELPAEEQEEEEEEPISISGKVLLQIIHISDENKLEVTIVKAEDMPAPDRGGGEMIQIHLCLIPKRKQRYRTKLMGYEEAEFNETHQFVNIAPDDIEQGAIRARCYTPRRIKKKLIGEARVALSQLEHISSLPDQSIWLHFVPKGLVDESIGAPPSKNEPPPKPEENPDENEKEKFLLPEEPKEAELYINLHYQDLTGRLHVEVIKAENLKPKEMVKEPNTFVRIKAISGKGKKIGKSVTAVHFLQSCPEYNETFVYPMSQVDLKEATIMFSVYMKGKRNKVTLLGWFALGQNTSGSNETYQWKQMVANPDTDVGYFQKLKTA